MTTQFPLTGPMSVGDLLDRAFRLCRARSGVFLLTAAIFLVPLGVISAVFLTLFSGISYPFLVQGALTATLNGQLLSITDYLVVLVALFAHGFVTLALTVQSIEMLHSRSLTVRESIHRGSRRLWSYMGMTITTLAALLAVSAIERLFNRVGFDMLDFLLDGLRSDLLDDSSGAGTTNSVSSLGMDLLAYFIAALLAILTSAPSYYLYARWLVAPAALLAEGLGPISSLRRSWQLSRGHIWRMIGYTVLLYLLVRLFNSLPMNLFQMILSVFLPDLNLGLQTGVVTAVQSTLFAVSTPFYIGAVVLLYYDLRIRGESYDLELRVADLEEQAV